MNTQNQIKRVLSEPGTIEYVAELLKVNEFGHRTALADFLCVRFEFYDTRNRAQRDGCLKALRELEAAGHYTLPVAQGKKGPNTPRRLNEPVADPVRVPA